MDWYEIFNFTLTYFMMYCAVFWLVIFFKNRKKIWKDPIPEKLPSVTIIIPAYNEEETISRAINSCLNLNYPKEKLEIIVVNDGSTDRTGEICRWYERRGLIKLIDKKINSGKADSLNTAIDLANGELIQCLDADSFLSEDSLIHLVGYFNDPQVAAVTPSMKVNNPKSLLQKIQAIEYMFGIFMRKMMGFLNCIHVTPGPGSVYRANILKKLKFSENTQTEDMEIALRLKDHGYKIECSLNSVAYTDAPKKMRDLLIQRRRWYIGLIQNSKKYSHFFFNRKLGDLGIFIFPSNVLWIFGILVLFFSAIYQIINNLILFMKYLILSNFDFRILMPKLNFPNFLLSINSLIILSIFLSLLGIISIYMGFKLSKESLLKNLGSYIFYLFSYFWLYSIFWIFSLTSYPFYGRKRGWKGDE